jgi:hypothetical protein
MNNLLYYILVVFFVSYIAIAQQLSGTITDADSGMPLPGATVLVKGSTNGTTTDFDGIFQLTNVSSNAILVISFIGYETQEIAVKNTTNFTIALSSAADALEEVVVVGYGTQRKKEVTGAVSVLGAKAIEKLNPVRPEQALQGQIAGVNITSQSGPPVLLQMLPHAPVYLMTNMYLMLMELLKMCLERNRGLRSGKA